MPSTPCITKSTDIHDPSSVAYKKARRQHLKTTKCRDNSVDLNWTPFRASEKRYKTRFPPPDLSGVLDLATLDESRVDEIARGGWRGRADAVNCRELAPNPLSRCNSKIYIIPGIPGGFHNLPTS
jgi:alkylated DNA repair protein alkB homolog 1